jgi:membrane associated rhomboid family serine protease
MLPSQRGLLLMIQIVCSCGGAVDVTADSAAEVFVCEHCQRTLRAISTPGAGAEDWAVLVIAEGPERVGEQLFIRGDGPIGIGSAEDNLIVLKGDSVEPHHGLLIRGDDGWRMEDLAGAGTLTINDAPSAGHDLRRGDVLGIGPFEFEYTGAPAKAVAHPAARPSASGASASAALAQTFTAPPPSQLGSVTCPSCGRSLPLDAKICVECGINLRTGRRLLTARGVDENELYARTETAVRALSWVLPFGLYPVASEAYGTRKPYVIWAVALITVIASVIFWNRSLNAAGEAQRGQNLMLWVGRPPAVPGGTEAPPQSSPGAFQIPELFTYALLHDGIFELAVNMLFLLVLGSRVNALLGQAKTAVLYPVLAILAGLFYLFAESHRPLHPMVGSSGAVMGLAGVYLILFPAHRVHTVAWVRTGISAGFRLAHNVFAVPGLTVVIFYLALDALLTLLRGGNSIDAWLHFGGFVAGIIIGLFLLLTRLADAGGGDILSMSLGRRAWLLIGKPGHRSRGDVI